MISYSFSHVLMDTPTPALSPAGAGTTIGAGSIAGIGSFDPLSLESHIFR